MNIVRKIKLEKLGYYICKDNKEKELFEFIKENLLNLTEVKLEYYKNEIFWFKKDKCIFNQPLNSDWFYVNDKLILEVFKTKFNYNNQELQHLIKGIIEKTYKIQFVIPVFMMHEDYVTEVEQVYKFKGKINKNGIS